MRSDRVILRNRPALKAGLLFVNVSINTLIKEFFWFTVGADISIREMTSMISSYSFKTESQKKINAIVEY